MSYVRGQIQVLGLQELDMIISKLPNKMSRKLVYSGMTRTIRAFTNRAKGLAPGKIKMTIGTKRVKKSNQPALWAGYIFKKAEAKDVYWAHWVEFGTSGIKKQTGYESPNPNPFFGGIVKRVPVGQRFQPKQEARPYIRPAWDTTKDNVEKEFIKQMKRAIEAHFRRYERKRGLR